MPVRASGLSQDEDAPQLTVLPEDRRRLELDDLERTKNQIREKYSYAGIQLTYPALDLETKRDNSSHPPG